MSYQVLARKWRPRNFDEMIGQEHVLRALRNALNSDRFHHACLFTGTRGVGKTTLARILAKCLNCEQGVSADPCGKCSACNAIDAGRFVDLIEVDAASRAKVDETRELMDNVPYAPTMGRCKVYLIDEIHMFSNHSFNALLKILEEPPEHVKFLLATTEPKRIPVTILSRCLQLNLRGLGRKQISERLIHILESEKIPHSIEAVQLLAAAAAGSLRDALSLLDQAISDGNGELGEQQVQAMLGTVDRERLNALLEALIAKDGTALLREMRQIIDFQPDFGVVLSELLNLLQQIAICQIAPDSGATEAEWERVRHFAAQLGPEETQLLYQIALTGRQELQAAPDPEIGFQMCLVRMLAFRPADLEPVQTRGGPDAPAPAKTEPAPSLEPAPENRTPSPAPAPAKTDPAPSLEPAPENRTPSPAPAPAKMDPAPSLEPAPENRTPSPAPAPAKTDPAPSLEPAPENRTPSPGPAPAKMEPAPSLEPAPENRTPSPAPAPAKTDPAPSLEPAPENRTPSPGPAPAKMDPAPSLEPAPENRTPSPGPAPAKTEPAPSLPVESSGQTELSSWWQQMVPTLPLQGLVKQIVQDCTPCSYEGDRLVLALDPARRSLLNEERKKSLRETLSRHLNAERLQIEFSIQQPPAPTPTQQNEKDEQGRRQQAIEAIRQDSNVQRMQQLFGATIEQDTIQPK